MKEKETGKIDNSSESMEIIVKETQEGRNNMRMITRMSTKLVDISSKHVEKKSCDEI